MSDLEKDLRDALRRTGEQVDPDVDAAWSTLARAPRRRPGRSLVILGAAAALLVVVAVSIAVLGRDDHEAVVTDSPVLPTLEGIPSEVLAVTTDGALVSIATADSMTTELAEVTGADALDLNPTDPDQLWYSECCEPADGQVRRMSLSGGEIEDQGTGYEPAVDPTGTRVAVASSVGLRVTDIATGEDALYAESDAPSISEPTWVDEQTIAFQGNVDGYNAIKVVSLDEPASPVEVVDGPNQLDHLQAPVTTDGGLLVAQLCCADDEEDVITAEPLLFDPETLEPLPPPPIDYQGEVVAQEEQDGWLLVTYADGRLVAHDLETGNSVNLAEDVRTATWGSSIPVTPASTTTTVPADGPVAPDPDAAMPEEAVAVAEDGRLVVLDTATGEPLRQLAAAGDPTEPLPPEGAAGAPSAINAVDVDPDSGSVMYSLCCEPISGTTFEVRLDGSLPPTERGAGLDPSIDGDGTFAMVATPIGLGLITGNQADIPLDQLLPEAVGSAQNPTWVTQGTIAFSVVRQSSVALGIFDQDDVDGLSAASYAPPDGQSWTSPAPWIGDDNQAAVLVAQQCCGAADPYEHEGDARAVVVDPANGTVLEELAPYDGVVVDQELATVPGDTTCCSPWLLVTYADGRLQGRNLLTGDVVAIAEGYRAAAW